MKTKFCYAFEELSDDLPRPPKAALRAMFTAGILVSPKGWKQLRNETRQALAIEGTRESVNLQLVAELMKEAPPGQIRLVSKTSDPPVDLVPAQLAKALGPMRTIAPQEWASLRALDRYVLATLATNTRLLWRALEEMASTPGSGLSRKVAQPWSGSLARCELKLDPDALDRLLSPRFLDGRAFVLARAAGVRAARKVSDVLDLQADAVAGPAELDWAHDRKTSTILWQAHVSTWDGEFFPAASMIAASIACVALYDMVKEHDPRATMGQATIAEEPWHVGNADREEATGLYSAQANPELFQHIAEPPEPPSSRAAELRDTLRKSPAEQADPYSSRARKPEPEPPPQFRLPEEEPEEPAAHAPVLMNSRAFLIMLAVSMLLVALVSTTVSIIVVRMMGR